jgi:hypothetical protein
VTKKIQNQLDEFFKDAVFSRSFDSFGKVKDMRLMSIRHLHSESGRLKEFFARPDAGVIHRPTESSPFIGNGASLHSA